MRSPLRRPWIKLYSIDCLEGSIRYQLEPAERSVWYELLLLSSICAIPGRICDKDERPYPHAFIANRLNISVELLERTLAKCIEEGRIQENAQGIIITNWHAYQSEYQRQKPYRQGQRAQADRDRYSRGPYGVCPVCRCRPCQCEVNDDETTEADGAEGSEG